MKKIIKDSISVDQEKLQTNQLRRDFLKTAGIITAGSLLLPRLSLAIGEGNINDVGIQLYTVRKEMSEDPIGTLKKLAKIGFKELESARSDKGNYYGLAPREIKKIADDLGMHIRSGHIHVDNDWQKSIEQATETGQEYIISAVLPSKGQTVEHYQASADEFNKLGEECSKANLSFGYHNHDTEFEKVNGQVLYDILLDRCDPKLVKLEMDLGWVVASGNDPFAYFNKYPGRFPLWHLKDVDLVQKKSVEFGKGKVDIIGLLKNAKKAGMRYYFVEQEDYAVNPFDSMEYDFNYLKTHPLSSTIS
jgi:sugar phosphate isomerase/epimerase